MNVDLGTVIAGLVGGLAGSLTTLVGAAVQHRFELRRDRLREARARTAQAAERCLSIVSTIANDIARIEYGRNKDNEELVDVLESKIRTRNGELFDQLLFLPAELRARVNSARIMLVFARELTEGGHHYLMRSPISRNAAHTAQEALAAFLRHEPLPDAGGRFHELEVAVADLVASRDVDGSISQQVYERRRSDFTKKHPELFVEE